MIRVTKIELYVRAAGGKRFKFEDNPSFFSLSGCSATVHLLDHRHFHVLGVVVVGHNLTYEYVYRAYEFKWRGRF